jgi:hypothetical protein
MYAGVLLHDEDNLTGVGYATVVKPYDACIYMPLLRLGDFSSHQSEAVTFMHT